MAERDHHSIGEVLAMVQQDFPDVTISKIRFLESQGLLDPERTTSGYRKFYDGDVDRLRWILHQQRDHYLPLKVIKDRIQNGFADTDTDAGAVADVDTDSAAAGERASVDPEADEDGRRPDAPRDGGHDSRTAESARSSGTVTATQSRRSTASSVATDPSTSNNPLDSGMSTVSMTAEELAAATGLTAEQVDDLRSYSLIESRTIGAADLYEGEALEVARLAADFIERGIEIRHLKMYRVAAEREAGFYEQVVSPLIGHRDPTTRSRARTEVRELVRLGSEMKSALLRRSLRDQLGGP